MFGKISDMTPRTLLLAALLALPPAGARAAVFLVGLDGADPAVVEELAAAGRLPALAGLMKEGAYARLDTLCPPPLSSPVIWTSAVTGVAREKHGITGFVKPGGGWYRTGDRRAPALWDMVSSRGRSAAAAGWLLTYPAEALNGEMVSNNYFMPIGTGSVVYPPGLELRTPRSYAAAGDGARLAAEISGFSPPEMFPFMPSLGTYDSEDFRGQYLFGKLGEYALADEGLAAVAGELRARGARDLFMLYLPGIDRVSHLAWGRYEAARAGKQVPFGGLVPAYYAYTDKLLARLLAGAGKDDTVIVMSDHGFKLREGAGPLTVVTGDHRPGGIFIAKGPAVRRGAKLERPLRDVDVAPTALSLLGLPAARDLDGRVAEQLFTAEALKARPVSFIDSYPAHAASEGWQDPPRTPQELERLRLSGYTR